MEFSLEEKNRVEEYYKLSREGGDYEGYLTTLSDKLREYITEHGKIAEEGKKFFLKSPSPIEDKIEVFKIDHTHPLIGLIVKILVENEYEQLVKSYDLNAIDKEQLEQIIQKTFNIKELLDEQRVLINKYYKWAYIIDKDRPDHPVVEMAIKILGGNDEDNFAGLSRFFEPTFRDVVKDITKKAVKTQGEIPVQLIFEYWVPNLHYVTSTRVYYHRPEVLKQWLEGNYVYVKVESHSDKEGNVLLRYNRIFIDHYDFIKSWEDDYRILQIRAEERTKKVKTIEIELETLKEMSTKEFVPPSAALHRGAMLPRQKRPYEQRFEDLKGRREQLYGELKVLQKQETELMEEIGGLQLEQRRLDVNRNILGYLESLEREYEQEKGKIIEEGKEISPLKEQIKSIVGQKIQLDKQFREWENTNKRIRTEIFYLQQTLRQSLRKPHGYDKFKYGHLPIRLETIKRLNQLLEEEGPQREIEKIYEEIKRELQKSDISHLKKEIEEIQKTDIFHQGVTKHEIREEIKRLEGELDPDLGQLLRNQIETLSKQQEELENKKREILDKIERKRGIKKKLKNLEKKIKDLHSKEIIEEIYNYSTQLVDDDIKRVFYKGRKIQQDMELFGPKPEMGFFGPEQQALMDVYNDLKKRRYDISNEYTILMKERKDLIKKIKQNLQKNKNKLYLGLKENAQKIVNRLNSEDLDSSRLENELRGVQNNIRNIISEIASHRPAKKRRTRLVGQDYIGKYKDLMRQKRILEDKQRKRTRLGDIEVRAEEERKKRRKRLKDIGEEVGEEISDKERERGIEEGLIEVGRHIDIGGIREREKKKWEEERLKREQRDIQLKRGQLEYYNRLIETSQNYFKAELIRHESEFEKLKKSRKHGINSVKALLKNPDIEEVKRCLQEEDPKKILGCLNTGVDIDLFKMTGSKYVEVETEYRRKQKTIKKITAYIKK